MGAFVTLGSCCVNRGNERVLPGPPGRWGRRLCHTLGTQGRGEPLRLRAEGPIWIFFLGFLEGGERSLAVSLELQGHPHVEMGGDVVTVHRQGLTEESKRLVHVPGQERFLARLDALL